jgi:hypothetical protein
MFLHWDDDLWCRSLKRWIRIGVQPKMLDPDPDEKNADPQPCQKQQQKRGVKKLLIRNTALLGMLTTVRYLFHV